MYEKELFDETLDINSTNNYEISIQVGLDGFSFSLLDIHRNRFIMLRDYSLNGKENELRSQVEDIIYKDDFLGKSYYRYRIVYTCERSTLIPAGLYDPAIKDEYFRLNHALGDEYTVINNRINDPDAFLLFDVRKDLNEIISRSFPDASLTHHLKVLLHSCFTITAGEQQRHIHINIESTYFNIVVIDNGKLTFLNTFRYRNTSDIMYYMLFIFEKLMIKNTEQVYFSGMIEKGDELYNNLLPYIKNVKLQKPSGSWSFSYVFDKLNGLHRYSNLFNIVNCV